MCSVVGLIWGSCIPNNALVALLRVAERTSGGDAVQSKEALKITGVTWCGQARGALFGGILPNGAGHFIFQTNGGKLMATMDAAEASELASAKQPAEGETQVQGCLKDARS